MNTTLKLKKYPSIQPSIYIIYILLLWPSGQPPLLVRLQAEELSYQQHPSLFSHTLTMPYLAVVAWKWLHTGNEKKKKSSDTFPNPGVLPGFADFDVGEDFSCVLVFNCKVYSGSLTAYWAPQEDFP